MVVYSQVSFGGQGDRERAEQIQKTKTHMGRFDAGLYSDCQQGMRAGQRMGKTPMGKIAGATAGIMAGAAKNYAGNFTIEKCKGFFKGK